MNNLVVKVVNKSGFDLPKYETDFSVGMDVRSIEEDVVLNTGVTKLFRTGLFVEIPIGYEIQVRSRSGLAIRESLHVLNSPGTIDPDYRGEIGVILRNSGSKPVLIDKGKKIAQLVLSQKPTIVWCEVDTIQQLSSTARGEGGFGHTGTKKDS